MSHDPNNIDRLLRERLDGFEMTPPADVWARTEAAINTPQKRKRGIMGWFFFGSVLLALFIGGVWYFNAKSEDQSTLAQHSARNTDSTSTSEQSSKRTLKTLVNQKNSDSDSNNPSSKGNIDSGDTQRMDQGSKPITALHENKEGSGKATNAPSNGMPIKGKTPSVSAETGTSGQKSGGEGLFDPSMEEQFSGGEVVPANTETVTFTPSIVQNIDPIPFFDIELFNQRSYSAIASVFDEDSLPKSTPFWKRISVEGSFGYSLFNIEANKNTTDPLLAELLKNAASGQRSFDARLGLNYHLTKNVSFQTGLEYSSARENYSFASSETTTYTYNDTISVYYDTVAMDSVYVINPISYDTTVLVQNESKNYYKMLTLPFQFAWKMSVSPRGELEFALGGSLSIYGKNTGNTIVDTSNYTIPSANAFHPTGILSVGGSIKYLHRFGMHHAVYIEPWARFGISNQSQPTLPYETRRNNYGIRVGYRFYF